MNDVDAKRTADARVSGTSAFRGRAQRLLAGSREIAVRHLGELLRAVYENVDDTLYALADKAENNRVQALYFDAMRQVRLRREAMESSFRYEFDRQFSLATAPRDPVREHYHPGSLNVGGLELELVGDEELEERLAATNLATKSEHRFQELLHSLAQRFAALLDRVPEDNLSPVHPRYICNAFRDSTAALGVDIRVKLILLKLFDRHVMANAGELYREINDYLLREGVRPDLRLAARQGQGARGPSAWEVALEEARATVAASDADADAFQVLRGLLAGQRPGGVVPAAEPSVAFVTGDVVAALSLWQRSAVVAVPGEATGSAEQIKAGLKAHLAELRGRAGGLDDKDADAIDLVGMLFDFIYEDPNLSAPLKAAIGRLQIPFIKVAILDKTFFAKRTHPARRLLNALMQAGVAGQGGDPASDAALQAAITDIVARILNEFDADLTLFTKLQDELAAFLVAERRRHEEANQRAIQAAELNDRLRREIAAELAVRIGDRPLPGGAELLLRQLWPEVLLAIRTTEGEDSAAWHGALKTVDELLWSLEPRILPLDRQRLIALIPGLVRALRAGLERINCEPERSAEVFRDLEAHHFTSLRAKTRRPVVESALAEIPTLTDTVPPLYCPLPKAENRETIQSTDGIEVTWEYSADLMEWDLAERLATSAASLPDLIDDEPLAVEEREPTVSVPEPPADAFFQQARDLVVGTWLELPGADGRSLRAKLEWKGDVAGDYLFVNWRYQMVAERTVAQLAAELRAGTARVMDDIPVFDRAMNAVMTRLLSSANHAP